MGPPDDTWPRRFFTEPLKNATSAGPVLSAKALDGLIDAYHDVRGWERKTGIPRGAHLEELGLEFAVAELEKSGPGIQD